MRAKLQHHLQGRNYSLGSFVDSYLLRYAIESSAYMSRNFDKELERYRQNPSKIDQNVDVSANVTMELGSERFEACEGLFKPELWGLDQVYFANFNLKFYSIFLYVYSKLLNLLQSY